MPFKRTGNYSQKAGDAISETLYFKNRLRGPCANTRVSFRLGSWNFSISIALVELSIELFVKFFVLFSRANHGSYFAFYGYACLCLVPLYI